MSRSVRSLPRSVDKLVVAFHETHVYLRVGPKPDDEGRRFDHLDEPLFELIRTIASGAKSRVMYRRLYVVRSRKPHATAVAIFEAAEQLQQYDRLLGIPDEQKRGKLLFCAANYTLSNLRGVAKDITRHFVARPKTTVRWPFLVVECKSADEADAEAATCAELKLPLGKRNTLCDLKL